jgi:hypothetical protein
MRILRSTVETPDFENLLTPNRIGEAGPGPATALPDPLADAPLAAAHAIEPQAERSSSFPAPRSGPYRPYWHESTFLRAVGLQHARCVAALCKWGSSGVVELGRSRLVVPGDLAQQRGPCSVPARLHRGAPWSLALPMELELIPWSHIFPTTWLALCPRRGVYLSRRYFRAGHALLDQLTAGLLLHAA